MGVQPRSETVKTVGKEDVLRLQGHVRRRTEPQQRARLLHAQLRLVSGSCRYSSFSAFFSSCLLDEKEPLQVLDVCFAVMGVGFVIGGDANEAPPWTPANKPTPQVLVQGS